MYTCTLYTVHGISKLGTGAPGHRGKSRPVGSAEYWNLELDYNNDRKLSSEGPDIISEGGD